MTEEEFAKSIGAVPISTGTAPKMSEEEFAKSIGATPIAPDTRSDLFTSTFGQGPTDEQLRQSALGRAVGGYGAGFAEPFVGMYQTARKIIPGMEHLPPETVEKLTGVLERLQHGIPHFLGSLAGYALPWGAAEKGVSAAVPALGKLAEKGLAGRLGAKAAQQALTGAAIGAATTGTPKGALESGVGAGLGAGLAEGAIHGIPAGAKALFSSLTGGKGMTPQLDYQLAAKLGKKYHRAGPTEKDLVDEDNEKVAAKLLDNYEQVHKASRQAYDNAYDAMKANPVPISRESRDKMIEDEIKRIHDEKIQGNKAAEKLHEPALKILANEIDPTQTPLNNLSQFAIADETNNKNYGLIHESPYPSQAAETKARDLVRIANRKLIKEESAKHPADSPMQDAAALYAHAKKLYADKMKNWETFATAKKGKDVRKTSTKLLSQLRGEGRAPGEALSPGEKETSAATRINILKPFRPKTGKDVPSSLPRMKQFARMLGDEDLAKANIKRNLFADTLDSKKPLQLSFNRTLKRYNSLNPIDKEYLFNAKERSLFDRASKIPQGKLSGGALHKMVGGLMKHYLMPVVAGEAMGAKVGHPLLGSIVAPILAHHVYPMLTEKRAGRLAEDIIEGRTREPRTPSDLPARLGGLVGTALTGGN